MTMVKGTIRNGQVVLPRPADWPDGTEVMVCADRLANTIGVPDDEWPTDQEGIGRLLARMDRVEPFDMSPEEEADVQAWRQEVKEYTLANQDKAVEGLFQ